MTIKQKIYFIAVRRTEDGNEYPDLDAASVLLEESQRQHMAYDTDNPFVASIFPVVRIGRFLLQEIEE